MNLTLGCSLSSEEHGPTTLVDVARQAEEAGFAFAMISDHFHPWNDRQGHSPFVWSVLGGIARETEHLALGTAVTCPTVRMHPAIVAHAAATVAAMMPGRFTLGLGTGEALNEHVVAARWPEPPIRLAMLEDAIHLIETLFEGGFRSHHGPYHTVEEARLYDLPEERPHLAVAATGSQAAELAARTGGLISTAPKRSLVEAYARAGGRGPRYGQLHVCWAEAEADARRTAWEYWPQTVVPGLVSTELPLPKHFEDVSSTVAEKDVAEQVVCGADPERHAAAIREFADAGFDHVFVHQIGPDQSGFLEFYRREVMPRMAVVEVREVA